MCCVVHGLPSLLYVGVGVHVAALRIPHEPKLAAHPSGGSCRARAASEGFGMGIDFLPQSSSLRVTALGSWVSCVGALLCFDSETC